MRPCRVWWEAVQRVQEGPSVFVLNSLALVVEQHMLLKVASLQDAVFHTSSDTDKDHRTDCFEASPDILIGVWFTDNPPPHTHTHTYIYIYIYIYIYYIHGSVHRDSVLIRSNKMSPN